MRRTHTAFLIFSAIGAASCDSNPLLPFLRGQRFDLNAINGQPLPWSLNSVAQIVDGWIQVDNDSVAERHEEQTGTLVQAGGWTRSGHYTIRHDTLFIDYGPPCGLCGQPGGPEYQIDTITASGAGLLRREVFPPDSIVRYYARP